MKKHHHHLLLGATLGFALLVAGCDTDGQTARIQEKSASYASLATWQKKRIEHHNIAPGFSPDMVYMAIGSPTAKQVDGQAEVWVYHNFYPWLGASQIGYNLDSENRVGDQNMAGGTMMMSDKVGRNNPSGTGTKPVSAKDPQSIAATGGPQGGSMEPADLVSYELYVTFAHGVVTKVQLNRS